MIEENLDVRTLLKNKFIKNKIIFRYDKCLIQMKDKIEEGYIIKLKQMNLRKILKI